MAINTKRGKRTVTTESKSGGFRDGWTLQPGFQVFEKIIRRTDLLEQIKMNLVLDQSANPGPDGEVHVLVSALNSETRKIYK